MLQYYYTHRESRQPFKHIVPHNNNKQNQQTGRIKEYIKPQPINKVPASKKVTLVTKEDLAFLRKVKSFSKDPKLINFGVDISQAECEPD